MGDPFMPKKINRESCDRFYKGPPVKRSSGSSEAPLASIASMTLEQVKAENEVIMRKHAHLLR